jgi:hypothetical protein
MNGGRDKRLAKLERHRRPPARTFYVWRNAPTESAKEAIARRFPEGIPPGARLVICSWQVANEPIPRTRG